MVEAFDDPGYTDGTYKYSALWAINQVRSNAGMPAIQPCGKEEFLIKLRNEWRVEFAFEDHRFWDIRRWKMGPETQKELYGVSITKNESGTKSYKKVIYESRFWNDRMYLYPISKSELYKNTNLLPQNPGW
nr:RagB/SusD family nutrient uptake outer membrane protein [Parabacteroides faecis]